MTTSLDIAIDYIRRGWAPIPIPARSKNPGRPGWQTMRISESDLPSYFNGKPQNVGVLLGEPSGGLIDVDLDHARAVELADSFLPHTPAVFGRASKPRSHRLYRVSAPVATTKFQSKATGILVEVRSTGCQTVFPGSVHPSGEVIEWDAPGADPAVVEAGELLAAVESLSNAVKAEIGEAPLSTPPAPTPRPQSPTPRSNGDAGEHWLAKALQKAVPGCRNQVGFDLATQLRDSGLTLGAAEGVLRRYAASVPGDGYHESEALASCRSAYAAPRREPAKSTRARMATPRTAAPADDPGDAPPTDDDAGTILDRDTELANAEALIRVHGANLRHDADTGRWLVWSGGFWTEDSARPAQLAIDIAKRTERRLGFLADARLRSFVKRVESAAGVGAVLSLASTMPGISIRHAALNANPWLFPCLNSCIDLRTGEVRSPQPGDLFTMAAPVEYDRAAECPRWMSFLDKVMDGNDTLVQYLQRLAGLCLTGDASVQQLWVFYGGGANGKSTFIDTLAAVLGPFACMAPDSLLIVRNHDEHPTEIASLAGRRMVVASENESGGRLRIQLVKKLTGDAVLTGRFMRQDYFEFPRTHKLVLVTNNRPAIEEDSIAVWRRIRLVPFEVSIPLAEQDAGLGAKLLTEKSGILNWMLAGLRMFLESGLQAPPDVMAATESYHDDSADHFAEFTAECLLVGDGMTCTRADLADTYASWSDRKKVKRPLDRAALLERVRRLPGVTDAKRRVGVQMVRILAGVGLAVCKNCTENGLEAGEAP